MRARLPPRVPPLDHNRALTRAARQRLAPLGLVRKGRSRTWIDDHGCWAIVVDFLHSNWTRGSYLYVYPASFWAPTATGAPLRAPHGVTWTNSTGTETAFIDLAATDNLDEDVRLIVEAAATSLTLWRSRLARAEEMETFLMEPFSYQEGGTEWDHWDLGAFYAFTGRWSQSLRHFLASRTLLEAGRDKYRGAAPEGFDRLFACLDRPEGESCTTGVLTELVAHARASFGLHPEWAKEPSLKSYQ